MRKSETRISSQSEKIHCGKDSSTKPCSRQTEIICAMIVRSRCQSLSLADNLVQADCSSSPLKSMRFPLVDSSNQSNQAKYPSLTLKLLSFLLAVNSDEFRCVSFPPSSPSYPQRVARKSGNSKRGFRSGELYIYQRDMSKFQVCRKSAICLIPFPYKLF